MPEHVRALIVVLGLAIPLLVMAKGPLCTAAYDESTFRRHSAMWLAVTIFAFLSHSFWLSGLLCALALYVTAANERVPLALYCAVLFAHPHFSQLLPGIGPIEHFFEVNHIRTLNLVVLLPVATSLYRDKETPKPISRAPDIALLGFLCLKLTAQMLEDSFVGTFRGALYLIVDIWVPYYVASRALMTIRDFREVAAAFLMATVILSLIAIFEAARHWYLYESLRRPFGISDGTYYLTRGEGGPLRPNVSVGGPIIVGYVIMVGLGMYTFLSSRLRPRWKGLVAGACVVAGLGASLSRGPWVGATSLILVMVVLGPGLGKRLAKSIAAGGVILIGVMTTSFGQRALDHLPFIGTVETGNITYRTLLYEVSMVVFWQNPIFGDTNFLQNPMMEQLRQGQGIIDMVNSYVEVALPYGAVGLFLFLGALLLPVHGVWRARKMVLRADPEAERLGRTMLAIMAGILVTIATVSSIGVIPTLYWLMAGLCVSYARVVRPLGGPASNRFKPHPQRASIAPPAPTHVAGRPSVRRKSPRP